MPVAASRSARRENVPSQDGKTEGRSLQFTKTKMCKFQIIGMCSKGTQCPFAHNSVELHALPDLSCTKLCKNLIQHGKCDNRNCNYAHSKEELRGTSSFHKTKMCRFFSQLGHCALGSKCNFAHANVELKPQQPVSPEAHNKLSAPPSPPQKVNGGPVARSMSPQYISPRSLDSHMAPLEPKVVFPSAPWLYNSSCPVDAPTKVGNVGLGVKGCSATILRAPGKAVLQEAPIFAGSCIEPNAFGVPFPQFAANRDADVEKCYSSLERILAEALANASKTAAFEADVGGSMGLLGGCHPIAIRS